MIREIIKAVLSEASIPGAVMFKNYEVVANKDDFSAIAIGTVDGDDESPIMLITSDKVAMKAELEISYKGVITEYITVDDVVEYVKTLFGFNLNTKDKVYAKFMKEHFGFIPESI